MITMKYLIMIGLFFFCFNKLEKWPVKNNKVRHIHHALFQYHEIKSPNEIPVPIAFTAASLQPKTLQHDDNFHEFYRYCFFHIQLIIAELTVHHFYILQ